MKKGISQNAIAAEIRSNRAAPVGVKATVN